MGRSNELHHSHNPPPPLARQDGFITLVSPYFIALRKPAICHRLRSTTTAYSAAAARMELSELRPLAHVEFEMNLKAHRISPNTKFRFNYVSILIVIARLSSRMRAIMCAAHSGKE